jgi:hypothetical protein
MAFSSYLLHWKRSIERRWSLCQALRRKTAARRIVARPRLEVLEDRWLLSSTAYVVTSTADSNTPGTLRYAINQVNAGNYNEIDFKLGTVGSVQTIKLTSQLPALTANGVYINGLSQGGSGNTTRLIQLNGTNAGASSDGLLLQGSDCTVSGLILSNFSNDGIEVNGANNIIGGSAAGAGNIISGNGADGVLIDSGISGVLVQGNYIGTNAAGTTAVANKVGIEDGGSSNTIGGSVSGARNVISGNSGDGVLIDSTATAETLQGNYIGLNAYGNAALANGTNGVEVEGVGNIIGGSSGTDYFVRNYISGNGNDGVLIDGSGSGNQILGNFVGLGVSGTSGVANVANGIEIAGSGNIVGGTISANKNVISGNGSDGVLLDSTAANNIIQGNYVGTDYTGQNAVSNSGNGIEIQGTGSTVGGTVTGARNIISGNRNDGVRIDSNASGTLVLGNYIGVDLSSVALGNGANGLNIASNNNIVGGTVTAARNIISGNRNDGVLFAVGANGNQVLGNYIGTNATGISAVANSIGSEMAGNGNTVGGASVSRNIISGNTTDGVRIDSGASGNQVLGNNIGTNAYGNAALGNSGNGIEVAGNGNTIGASYAVAPNVISNNSGDGVLLDSTASGNQVLGNYIGTNPAGTAAMANKVGVEDGGSSNTIGGSVLGARNVISGNTGDGVLLDSTATGETIQGNYIGLNVGGNVALANGNNGIEVQGINNTIGGSSLYYTRNFLSGNGHNGLLLDSGASGNQVLGNFIGLGVSGTNGVGNAANGVEIAGSHNTIGGTIPSSPTITGTNNYISGNSNDGVLLDSTAADNQVLGNDVGTDYTGTSAVGNSGNGIEILGAGNTLGGTVSGAGNIISGNSSAGVVIASSASGTLVQGNSIGLNVSGAALGNGGYGVSISSNNNTIGGGDAGAGNSIASNQTGGVLVNAGSGNTISQNSIFANGSSNTDPGITLSNGGNNNLAAPSLKSAKLHGHRHTHTKLIVKGSFTPPTAKATYVLEFFANPTGDAEGQIYLGSLTVTPKNTRTHKFTFSTTTTVTGTNPLITVTLTDAAGDTSAFSNGVTVK